jgi:hypothetical protein
MLYYSIKGPLTPSISSGFYDWTLESPLALSGAMLASLTAYYLICTYLRKIPDE